MRKTPHQPATDEEVATLRNLVRERDEATTIYPDDNEHFAIKCDKLLPKLLARLDAHEGGIA